MLIARVAEDQEPVMSDSAVAAMSLTRSLGRGILKMMRTSDHGRYLEEIGFAGDIRYCAAVDSVPVVPLREGNVFRLRREPASSPVNS
jgi:phosphosulfolactate phosphohydrolase-like enzyme